MKWFCCCCERCWPSSKRKEIDDVNLLVPDPGSVSVAAAEVQVAPFYVPRRHSSYTAGSFTSVYVQPGENSDSCSSSCDEEGPVERGRYWSEVPTSNENDLSMLTSKEVPMNALSDVTNWNRPFVSGRRILSEIAETETTEEERDNGREPAGVCPSDGEIYGYLTFGTKYDDEEQKLTIFLEKATDLPQKGTLAPYDTFVKLLVTSSRKNFRLSRAVKNSITPIYEEEFVIHISRNKWKTSRNNFLQLSVFDCDRQGRHDAIGHVTVPVGKLTVQKLQNHSLPITPMSVPTSNIGQMLLSLSYSAPKSRLSIHVIKARHLRIDPEVYKHHFRPIHRDVCDTFVKVTLMCGGQKVKTTRSRVVLESKDPLYNHRCYFVVPPQFLLDSSLVIAVMLRGVLGRSAAMGRVTVGPYTALHGGSLTHWGQMVQDCRPVARWRNLYL